MDFKELIDRINRNTAAQKEQTKKWRQELGLPDPEPTELDLLLQKWEQARVAPQSPKPEGKSCRCQSPEGKSCRCRSPEGRSCPCWSPEGKSCRCRSPEGRSRRFRSPEGRRRKAYLHHSPDHHPCGPVRHSCVRSLAPRPSLLDTLSVGLDLPLLDLEPRSRQKWTQFSTWFPAPLLPDTNMLLHCSQTSLTLPLVTASLPLGDRTSLLWVPAADLCPLLQPPVPQLSFPSPLTNRWGPSSPVRGPFLAGPRRGPIHPRVRPWKRAKVDICGLEANAMYLGSQEMVQVMDRDNPTIEKNLDKIIFYYGSNDQWCPVQYYEDIKKDFPEGDIRLCERGIRHAFVLDASKEVASMITDWLHADLAIL
ncbi:UNVERIFIED_CONTAM: hypothetical protein FKN15_035445 [Acipenser sinensis]